MGATGAIGGYTVQMARSYCAHVIATVRGNADEARRLGAEEVYDTKAVEVVDAMRASHPNGVDAVLDLVNGSHAIRRSPHRRSRSGHQVLQVQEVSYVGLTDSATAQPLFKLAIRAG